MSVRVAINGFGRIGRNILRAAVEADRNDIEVVAINDLAPVETNAHLLRYDSVHGRFPGEVTVKGDTINCGNGAIKVTAIKDPTQLPWKELGIDVALECTGIFTVEGQGGGASQGRRQARAGLGAGRRRRPHRRLRRQPRQADQGAHGRLQRLVHDQLPGAGRQGAQRRRRHRQGLHDHGALLHQRPAVARSGAQGSLPGARRGAQHDPDLDRRGEGGRPGAAGTGRPARRRRHPRADAERLGGRFQVRRQARDHQGRDQRRGEARRRAAAQGHPRLSPTRPTSRATSTTTRIPRSSTWTRPR